MLAALPKAPSRYNPINNLKEATFRRDLVLKNLMENNFISKKEYGDLIKNKFKDKKKKNNNFT